MLRIALALGIILTPTMASALNVGDTLPDFALKDSRGKKYTLKSFHQKVMVFWYEGAKSKEQNRWLKNWMKKLRVAGMLKKAWYRSVGIANFDEHWASNGLISWVIKRETAKTGALILEDRNGAMKKKWGVFNGRSNIIVCRRQADGSYRVMMKQSGPASKARGVMIVKSIIRWGR